MIGLSVLLDICCIVGLTGSYPVLEEILSKIAIKMFSNLIVYFVPENVTNTLNAGKERA